MNAHVRSWQCVLGRKLSIRYMERHFCHSLPFAGPSGLFGFSPLQLQHVTSLFGERIGFFTDLC